MRYNYPQFGEKSINMDKLNKTYLEVIKEVLPGRAIRWGINNIQFKPLTLTKLNENLNKLSNIEGLLSHLTEMSIEKRALLQSVRQRKFEIEYLEQWKNSPYFYFERQILDIVNLFIDNYNLNNKEFNHSLILNLNGMIRVIQENLEVRKISIIDLQYTDYSLSLLIEKVNASNLSIPDKKKLLETLNVLKTFFYSIKKKIKKVINPIKVPILEKLIEMHCGVNVDLMFIKDLCKNNLKKNKILEKRKSDKNIYITKTDIELCYKKITRVFFNYYPISPDILLNIPIEFVNSKYRIRYQRINILNSDNYKIIISLSHYNNMERLLLDIVHEVFPGHHFERTAYYNFTNNRISLSTYEDIFFIEGWAQISQDIYCNLSKNNYLSECNLRDKLIIQLKALCVILIHEGTLNWAECLQTMCQLTNLDKNIINSMLIDAYLEPIDNIAPFVGYLILKNVPKNNQNIIFGNNRFILWGASLNAKGNS